MGSITPASIRELAPGAWLWERGVGVYKARDGSLSWYVRYMAQLPDRTRFQVEERVPDAQNKKQASDVRTARQAEVFRGTWKPHEKIEPTTFASFAEEDFLDAKRAQLYGSVETYEKHIRLYLVPHFGRTITLGGITEKDCKEFYEKMLGEHSVAYANNIANSLKSIYTEAIAQELALKNPARSIATINPDNARKRRITPAEAARLFEAAAKLPWRKGEVLYHVLYWTGMRIDEAQTLERGQVDIEHLTFRHIGTKSGVGRDVPILPELAPRLRAWLDKGAGERFLFAQERHRKEDAEGKLPPEKPVSNTPVRKWWAALLRQTAKPELELPAITDLTPHDLRHHFAKLLVDRGVAPRVVMKVLGWTSWQMLQRYVLPDEDEVREELEKAIRGDAA